MSSNPTDSLPRISVIIPTLNEANNIENILRQVNTGENIEIILADGGKYRRNTRHRSEEWRAHRRFPQRSCYSKQRGCRRGQRRHSPFPPCRHSTPRRIRYPYSPSIHRSKYCCWRFSTSYQQRYARHQNHRATHQLALHNIRPTLWRPGHFCSRGSF
jgi:hypothetical protein